MAFRKRRFFRRRINGKLSRKHYTWVTALNTKCALTTLSHCVPETEAVYCCPSSAQLVLLDNAVIQSSFQDAIKVVRIHGELSFAWNLTEVLTAIAFFYPDCSDYNTFLYAYLSTFNAQIRSGIAIREVHNGDLTTLPRMNPIEDFDFSEGRWKQMRFHHVVPHNAFNVNLMCEQSVPFNGVCSSVTGTSPGATSTVCSTFPLPPLIFPEQANGTYPTMAPPAHFRYNNKLNLRVRENQLPVMSIGWANVDFTGGQLPPPRLDMTGGVKLLIEVG